MLIDKATTSGQAEGEYAAALVKTSGNARGRDAGDEPAVVRRAAEFIDANAHRKMSIVEIAEAARISTRGLQVAFRRHRGQTPVAYLRQVRMEGACRDLMAGDPQRGDTVSCIARRWRLTNPGRFAAAYRHVYGCPPSNTLRR